MCHRCLCSALTVISATLAQADTISYSHDYGSIEVDLNLDEDGEYVAFTSDTWNAQIDQFDSSLGSLKSIAFDFSVDFEIGASTNETGGAISGGMGGGGSFYYDATSNTLQYGAGNGGGGGTDGPNSSYSETFTTAAAWTLEESEVEPNQWSSLVEAVTGSGSWTFIWTAEMGGGFDGLDSLDLDSTYARLNGGGISVTYTYEASSNPVPGPAAALAVAAIWLARPRRRG